MSKNAPSRDLRTVGYVLRRNNFGEADRILGLITPFGKVSVVARGVRREKSKLAGAIELFTRSEINLHFGRGELAILTGAKMQRFFSGIIQDFARMELAAEILRRIDKAAEAVDLTKIEITGTNVGEYFSLADQSLTALNAGAGLGLVHAWFLINLKRVMGEEVNLYRDAAGAKLAATEKYNWNSYERAFEVSPRGRFGANEIKLLRLLASNELAVVQKIKYEPSILEPILTLVQEL